MPSHEATDLAPPYAVFFGVMGAASAMVFSGKQPNICMIIIAVLMRII